MLPFFKNNINGDYQMSKVAIIMGSKSDFNVVKPAVAVINSLDRKSVV